MVQDSTGKPVDYIFLEVNSSFEALTGFPRDHIIGKKVTKLYPGIKGLGFDWIGVFDQVTAIGIGHSIHFQQYLDQRKRWYEITAYSDQPGYSAVVFRDITENKKAEEELRQREKNFSILVENTPDMIVRFNLDLQHIYCNKAVEHQFGVPVHRFIGKTFLEIDGPPEQLKSMHQLLKKALETGKEQQTEQSFPLPSGQKYFQTRIVPERDEKGRIESLLAVTRDITERKQAEDALRESEERYRTMFERTANPILIIDTEGNYLSGNETALQFLECTREELLLKNVRDTLPPGEQATEVMRKIMHLWESGGRTEREYYVNGKIKVLDLTISPCMWNGKRAIFGLGTDITEHKQVERELIHSERMAIAGQLAAGVAHEFSNLLSIIGGSAEYAKGIRNENEIKKSLDVIVKSANRGAQVVKKLLKFTKRIELKKESVDLIEVIEEVVGLFKRDLENNSITVVRNYSDIPKILIDVGQIQQVFLNLIINAKNAMSKGGKLAINAEKEGKFIKIQFHNTGKIINKEDLPRLFTPFFRINMRQKEGMPGIGLGLAVSYGIIKAHNGVISAESVKGKGTTFTILLSVTKNENMAEVLPKAVTKTGKNNKIKLKQVEILIVDDEVEIRKLFKKVLDKEGYSVTVADSGGNALNLCRKKKFDLIYLDIIMPGMDGISVFKKIKGISPKTKIVFFTGKLIEDKVAGMYLDEGAAGFLRKPIPLKDLVSYTQNILKVKNEKNLLLF
jgi:PAS domain S-box-containing protein